jgi:predicted Zn-dependent protease
VRFRVGIMKFEAKDYVQAAVAFTQVLEDSTAPDVRSASRYNLALCERLVGQPDEARTALESYRKEFPSDSRAAEVAYQLGDLNETAGHSRRPPRSETALAAKPSATLSIEVAFRLGRVKEQLGDTDAAARLPDRDRLARIGSSPIGCRPWRARRALRGKKDRARAGRLQGHRTQRQGPRAGGGGPGPCRSAGRPQVARPAVDLPSP